MKNLFTQQYPQEERTQMRPPGCHVSLTADRVLVFCFFLSSVKVVEE